MDTQNIPKSPFSALEQWEPDSRPVTLQRGDHKPFWGADGFTFGDVLDMVNPLQHIPVASKQYQETTGDTASDGAKLVGGAVFGVLTGGVLGLVGSLVNAAVRHDTGKDLTDHAMALMQEESSTQSAESATKGGKTIESGAASDASIENKVSISSTESPANPQPVERTNFFVDDVAARSLHPAERLLAISSHHAPNQADDSSDNPQQELQRSPEVSMEHKASKAYREVDAQKSGQFWWEV